MDARECLSAVGAGLVARSGGVCVVADPDAPQVAQTIFEHVKAAQIREHHLERVAAEEAARAAIAEDYRFARPAGGEDG